MHNQHITVLAKNYIMWWVYMRVIVITIILLLVNSYMTRIAIPGPRCTGHIHASADIGCIGLIIFNNTVEIWTRGRYVQKRAFFNCCNRRHDNIRDFLVCLLKEFCISVQAEPHLTDLSGEELFYDTAITSNDARLDIKARGLEERARCMVCCTGDTCECRVPEIPRETCLVL